MSRRIFLPWFLSLVSGQILGDGAPEHEHQRQTRAMLFSAKQTSDESCVWAVQSDAAALTLKPFTDIQDEEYTAYVEVLSS